jgi:hypothetical protein
MNGKPAGPAAAQGKREGKAPAHGDGRSSHGEGGSTHTGAGRAAGQLLRSGSNLPTGTMGERGSAHA